MLAARWLCGVVQPGKSVKCRCGRATVIGKYLCLPPMLCGITAVVNGGKIGIEASPEVLRQCRFYTMLVLRDGDPESQETDLVKLAQILRA